MMREKKRVIMGGSEDGQGADDGPAPRPRDKKEAARTHNCVLHQDSEGASDAEVEARDGPALLVAGDDDALKARLHVGHVGGQRENGHQLARHGNVKLRRALVALLRRRLPHLCAPARPACWPQDPTNVCLSPQKNAR